MKKQLQSTFILILTSLSSLLFTETAFAQDRSTMTPRELAPIDLSGYWVSIVSEDWRWRMVTPAPGDYASIPITPAAKAQAGRWDPAADEAAELECRSYGAPAIMRVPGRIRFEWLDDWTLQMEADAGTQTRVFHFRENTQVPDTASWQGHSVAQWDSELLRGGLATIGSRESFGPPPSGPLEYGSLKAVTSNLLPGYLRKNGVPYSEDAELTEYFDIHVAPNGERWLIVTSVVHDPVNLQLDWLTSLNFKADEDGRQNWSPTPCSARW